MKVNKGRRPPGVRLNAQQKSAGGRTEAGHGYTSGGRGLACAAGEGGHAESYSCVGRALTRKINFIRRKGKPVDVAAGCRRQPTPQGGALSARQLGGVQ